MRFSLPWLFRFRRDERGVAAMIFALAIVPVVGLVGAAIDYGRAASVETRLQTALDAAVLSAASAGSTTTEAQLNSAIANWMEASYPSGGDRTVTTTIANGVVNAEATQYVHGSFMKLVGVDGLQVRVRASAVSGSGADVEVVLAIDTTLSMDKILPTDTVTKFEGAKSAAKSLIDKLFARTASGAKVKLGLVPFDWHIRLPVAYKTAPWITHTDDVPWTTPGYCYTPMVSYDVTQTPNGTFDCGVDGQYQACTSYAVTYTNVVYGPEVCVPEQSGVTQWTGCVGSRLTSWNTTAVSSTDPEYGLMESYLCRNEIMRLTDQPDPLKAAIDAFTMNSWTYIPAALQWSWRLLQPPAATEAFGDGSPITNNVQKFIVLLSDGANTVGPQGYYHNYVGTNATTGEGVPVADDRMAQLCSNIKASGIQIFTISFDNNDVKSNQLLSACASGPPFFYKSANVSQLLAAFESIGGVVAKARLTK